jgi:NAD(P)-dependent dehydrogenase (short-subunit alcohol dehydrogenase family)
MQPIEKESELSILKGKTAVVTGSTSGIGLGCARAFAGAGANIVLNGIGAPADVEKTRSAIENDFGVKAIYSPANMAEPMEIASMISLAEKTFGCVDVLVNNAASSMSRQSRIFRSESGTQSSQSTCPPHSMRSVPLLLARSDEVGAESSIRRRRIRWSHRHSSPPTSQPSTA